MNDIIMNRFFCDRVRDILILDLEVQIKINLIIDKAHMDIYIHYLQSAKGTSIGACPPSVKDSTDI